MSITETNTQNYLERIFPDRKFDYLIVELKRIMFFYQKHYTILSTLRDVVSPKTIISSLLAISINRTVSPMYAGKDLVLREDDPISLVWDIVEKSVTPARFDSLPHVELDNELHALLKALDELIGKFIPPSWGYAEFTFHAWLGETTIVLLKDG